MKKVEEYYNLISEKYDKATSDFNWTAPKEIESVLKKHNLIEDGLEVLDLGVGTGQNIEFLQSKNCNIYGVDISEKMLEVAKDKYPNVKIYKYDVCEGLSNLFEKDKFDLIIAGGILE
ncbi:MAG: class I SAM-dependent methyltransferase, partial [Candidatus Pacebacteria bacterium]|nr:class I SAM-dependent methyltransferase [Candidatus Paceibacterota bacterium]